MNDISVNDLILYQRGELSDARRNEIEKELKTNKKLLDEYEVLKNADLTMERHFEDFKIPNDFQLKVKNKFKEQSNIFSFLNSKLLFTYASGIATACFMFAFIYSIDPFLQLQGQNNNEPIVRSINKSSDLKNLPKMWIVNENVSFQMIKVEGQNLTFVNEGDKLSTGSSIFIRIIPLQNEKVSIFLKSKDKVNLLEKDILFEKGIEVLLPKIISPDEKFFLVEGPSGKETFILKDTNNQVIFDFTFFVN